MRQFINGESDVERNTKTLPVRPCAICLQSGHDRTGRSSPKPGATFARFMMRQAPPVRCRRPFDAAWQRQPEAKSAELQARSRRCPAADGRELDGGTAVARTVVQDRPPQSQRWQPRVCCRRRCAALASRRTCAFRGAGRSRVAGGRQSRAVGATAYRRGRARRLVGLARARGEQLLAQERLTNARRIAEDVRRRVRPAIWPCRPASGRGRPGWGRSGAG